MAAKCQAANKQVRCKQIEICFTGTSSGNNPRPAQRSITYRQASIKCVYARRKD